MLHSLRWEKNHLMLPSTMVRDSRRKEGKVLLSIWKLWTKGDFVLYDTEKGMTEKKITYSLGRIWCLLQCRESEKGQWKACCSGGKANAYTWDTLLTHKT